jgi:hypothetical protein
MCVCVYVCVDVNSLLVYLVANKLAACQFATSCFPFFCPRRLSVRLLFIRLFIVRIGLMRAWAIDLRHVLTIELLQLLLSILFDGLIYF